MRNPFVLFTTLFTLFITGCGGGMVDYQDAKADWEKRNRQAMERQVRELGEQTRESDAEWLENHSAYLQQLIAAAEKVAAGNERSAALVAEFKKQALPTRLLPGAITKTIATDPGVFSRPFIPVVLATTPEEARWMRSYTSSSFSWARGEFNFAPNGAWDVDYMAIVAIHEMSHWDDQVLSGREPKNLPMHSDAWIGWEVLAHELENDLYDTYTDGAMSEAIQTVFDTPELHREVPGSTFLMPTEQGLQSLLNTWPRKALSHMELEHRASTLLIAFNLAQAKDETDKIKAYRTVVDWGNKRMLPAF